MCFTQSNINARTKRILCKSQNDLEFRLDAHKLPIREHNVHAILHHLAAKREQYIYLYGKPRRHRCGAVKHKAMCGSSSTRHTH